MRTYTPHDGSRSLDQELFRFPMQQTRAVVVKEIGTELSHLPESIREQMLDIWLGGIITQVTSLPACVRIERWIHQEYPTLRR